MEVIERDAWDMAQYILANGEHLTGCGIYAKGFHTCTCGYKDAFDAATRVYHDQQPKTV